MQIKNLLITGIGGDIAQSTAIIIRKNRPNIRLIGVDIEVRHAGAIFVDEFETIPNANHPQYLPSIKKLIKKFSINVLLPMSEAELTIFVKIDDKIGDCIIAHCGKKGLDVGLDKFKTNQFLQSINVLYPQTVIASEAVIDNITLPCILKPNTGSGSKGIFVIEDTIDFKYYKNKYPNSIFQELLTPKDQEITCAVYRTKTKEVYVLPMLRRLIGGTTGWATVIKDKKIDDLCIRIANKLDILGGINIQLINTNHGAYIFEINPRISSTVAMRDAIGFKDVIWLLEELEGGTPCHPNIQKGIVMHKIHSVSFN